MTTEYNVGDLVEISKGEVIVRDRLKESLYKDGRLFLPSQHPQRYIDALLEEGWTVTVIEKAAPKNVLPTEAGWYLNSQGQVWQLAGVGDWRTGSERLALWEAELLTGSEFTRLEPVPVTAAKIIAEVRGIFGGPGALLHKDVDKIAERFGVSS